MIDYETKLQRIISKGTSDAQKPCSICGKIKNRHTISEAKECKYQDSLAPRDRISYPKVKRMSDIIRKKILELVGDIQPRIELFPRTLVHGWEIFGNDEKLKLAPLESYL